MSTPPPGSEPRRYAPSAEARRPQVGPRQPGLDPNRRTENVRRPLAEPHTPSADAGRQPAPRRSAAARAWSELDKPRTAMMPAAPAAAPGPAGGGPVGPPPVPPHRVPGGAGGGGRPPTQRTPGGILAGRILSAFVAALVLIVTGIGFFTNFSGNSSAQEEAKQAAPKDPTKGMNILLIGADSRTNADGSPLSAEELRLVATQASDGVNTDTIMLVHIPDGGGKATAVSIPRDTWIGEDVVNNLPGPYSSGKEGDYKPNKVNSFYGTAKAFTQEYLAKKGVNGKDREFQSSEAGRKMLIQVISKFTGLHIDHYAEVNLIAFYTISNAIGGVPVCLKKAVDDPWSGAKFPAGQQQVQGTAALSFVRQRHGLPGGDLDRVRRQQAFLAGAIKKVLSNPTSIPSLASAAKKTLVMDSGLDLLTLGQQMRNLSSGNVNFTTIPTHGAASGTGTDALATDPAEIRSFFANLDGRSGSATGTAATGSSTAASKTVVDVQNGTMTAGLGGSVVDALKSALPAGYTVGKATDMPGKSHANQLDTTEIRYPAGAKAAATAVQKALGFGTTVEKADVSSGHVLVVAGKDAPAPASGLWAGNAAIQVPAIAAAPITPISADQVGCVN
jgi:LCP family protein required for cell wall assembly